MAAPLRGWRTHDGLTRDHHIQRLPLQFHLGEYQQVTSEHQVNRTVATIL